MNLEDTIKEAAETAGMSTDTSHLGGLCDCGEPARHELAVDCLDCARKRCLAIGQGWYCTHEGQHLVARPKLKLDQILGGCEACWNGSRHLHFRAFAETKSARTGQVIRDGYECVTPCVGHEIERRCELLTKAKLPGRYAQAGWATLEPMSATLLDAQDRLRAWAEGMSPGDKGKLLQGPNGTGKTHVLVAMVKTMSIQGGHRVRYADWRDLVSAIKDTWETDDSTGALLKKLETAPVLVLDELGNPAVEKEWQREPLERVLGRRYNTPGTTTIFASNYKGASLAQRIGKRLHSRLHEMAAPVPMPGVDYRLRKAGKA